MSPSRRKLSIKESLEYGIFKKPDKGKKEANVIDKSFPLLHEYMVMDVVENTYEWRLKVAVLDINWNITD